jgi:hypothetical protein
MRDLEFGISDYGIGGPVQAFPRVGHFKLPIRNLVSRLVVLVMLVGAGPATAAAQARLISGGGRIEVLRQGVSTQAIRNQMLLENDRLRTGLASFASVEFGIGNRAMLGEQTEVEFQPNVEGIRVLVERGTLRIVSHAPVTVVTSEGEFVSAGGSLDMNLSYREGRLTFAIAKGSVNTNGLSLNVTIASAEHESVRTYVTGRRSHHTFDPVPHPIHKYLNFIYPNVIFSPRARGYPF